MSQKRRYRKWSVRGWDDDKFRALSKPQPNAQTLYMFLVLGPYSTAFPGAFRAGRAAMAEDLDWSVEDFDRAFDELAEAEMVHADWRAKLVYVPGALKHNHPESPNVCKAWAKALLELPDSKLQDQILSEVATFLKSLKPAFPQAFLEAFGKSSKTLPASLRESVTGTEAVTGTETTTGSAQSSPAAASDRQGSEGSRTSVFSEPPPQGCGDCNPLGYKQATKKPCTCALGRWRKAYRKATGKWPATAQGNPGPKNNLNVQEQSELDALIDSALDPELPV